MLNIQPHDVFPVDAQFPLNSVSHFFFKCEDHTDDGAPVGPVYAIMEAGPEVRSRRYVTLREAKQLASAFGAELQEF